MTIKPGGRDDPAQGWTGATPPRASTPAAFTLPASSSCWMGRSPNARCGRTSAYSPGRADLGPDGRSMIRGILNSACNVHPQDNTPQAASARRIQGFHELDGIEFLARVDVEKGCQGRDRNVVKLAIEPDHRTTRH